MSRVGEKPITIPSGVTVTVEGEAVRAKGPLGEMSVDLPVAITAAVEDNAVTLSRAEDSRECRSFHGLARSLVSNAVEGVSKGFSKELEIEGVGFRAAIQGQKVTLSLGFSSPVVFEAPEGVKVTEEGGTKLVISGPDKQKVGDTAARLRGFMPAEPYKGKGLHYKGEYVRRKVGKTVA